MISLVLQREEEEAAMKVQEIKAAPDAPWRGAIRSEKTVYSNPPSLSTPQKIVTIHVGKCDAQQTFYCYKVFLCYYSRFFNTAFNIKFEEGDTQTMNLEDEDSKLFGIFYQWTLCQTLDSSGPRTRCTTLVKIWFLVDKFLCTNLQNTAMRELYDSMSDTHEIEHGCVDYVFEHASKDHPLYEILISGLALNWKENHVLELFEDYPSKILFDLMVRVRLLEVTNDWHLEVDSY